MANTIDLTLRVREDGKGFDLVDKKAKKTAKSVDSATNASDRYMRKQKGVGQAGLSSAKSFSKMQQGIQTGLVPAYATLAANVFALTALFGQLSKVASLRLLEEGIVRVGNASGQNLPALAKNLRDITGAAISTETALRSTALAVSSGFSSEQLEGLTKVARGASIALGRDMTDALDRLVRGTAKLEPEILDELGIMVRLDDAVAEHAKTLGKTAQELTQFERRQAFLNATIEQGTKKFGEIAEKIETSPYDKLAATFADLSKTFIGIINNALGPLIKFLSESPMALVSVLTLFAGTLVKQITPALSESANAASKASQAAAARVTQLMAQSTARVGAFAKRIKSFDFAPPSVARLQTKLQAGQIKGKELTAVIRNLSQSEKLRNVALKRYNGEELARKRAELASVTALKNEVLALQAAERGRAMQGSIGGLGGITQARTSSRIGRREANAMNLMQDAGPIKGFKIAFGTIKNSFKDIKKVNGALARMSTISKVAASSVRLLGTAFLNAIPILGQILMVVSILGPMIMKFFEKSKADKAVDELTKSFAKFSEVGEQLKESLEGARSAAERFVMSLKVETGLLDQLVAGFKAVEEAQAATFDEKIVKINKEINRLRNHGNMAESIRNKALAKQNKLLEETLKKSRELSVETKQGLIDSFLSPIKNSETLSSTMGDSIVALEKLKEELGGEGGKDINVLERLNEILGDKKGVIASIESAAQASSDFEKEITKLGKSGGTKFDPMIDKLQALRNELVGAGKEGGMGFRAFLEQSPDFAKRIENFRGQVKGGTETRASKTFGPRVFITSDAEIADKMLDTIKKQNTAILTQNSLRKVHTADLNKIKGLTSTNTEALRTSFTLEDNIRQTKIDELKAQKIIMETVTLTKEQQDQNLAIQNQINALITEKRSDTERALLIEQSELNLQKQILDITNKRAAAQKTILQNAFKMEENALKLRKLAKGETVTAKDTLDLIKAQDERKRKLIDKEYKLNVQAIRLEYDLLRAQTRLQMQRAKDAGLETEFYESLLLDIAMAEGAALRAAKSTKKLQESDQSVTVAEGRSAAGQAALSASGTGDTTTERMREFMQAGGLEDLDKMKDKAQALANVIQPMIETLKTLGPEGELAAAVAGGMSTITVGFGNLMDILDDDNVSQLEKTAAKISMVSSMIASVNQMLAASSQARIANIDREIAAEQKRDGKTKASVNKIKAMEARKEAIARKAFETNKKLQMAQIVMNTASAYMGIMAHESGKMGVMAALLAKVALVIGAAQLAIVAGTSYQGGASSIGSGGGPSSISMGERANRVNLANANNAAGELAFMRGERGIGRIENFRPAFGGYKMNRAAGGFVVGEQGPELFMPQVPGEIIPSGKSPTGTTNVNFSINAVDASGVEELLINQKGNIIEMIRDAANEHGHDFLEDVATETYR